VSDVLFERYGLAGHTRLSMSAIVADLPYVPSLEVFESIVGADEILADLADVPAPTGFSLFFKPQEVLETVAKAYVQSAQEYYQCWCRAAGVRFYDAWDDARIPTQPDHVVTVDGLLPWAPHVVFSAEISGSHSDTFDFQQLAGGDTIRAYRAAPNAWVQVIQWASVSESTNFSGSVNASLRLVQLPAEVNGLLEVTTQRLAMSSWLQQLGASRYDMSYRYFRAEPIEGTEDPQEGEFKTAADNSFSIYVQSQSSVTHASGVVRVSVPRYPGLLTPKGYADSADEIRAQEALGLGRDEEPRTPRTPQLALRQRCVYTLEDAPPALVPLIAPVGVQVSELVFSRQVYAEDEAVVHFAPSSGFLTYTAAPHPSWDTYPVPPLSGGTVVRTAALQPLDEGQLKFQLGLPGLRLTGLFAPATTYGDRSAHIFKQDAASRFVNFAALDTVAALPPDASTLAELQEAAQYVLDLTGPLQAAFDAAKLADFDGVTTPYGRGVYSMRTYHIDGEIYVVAGFVTFTFGAGSSPHYAQPLAGAIDIPIPSTSYSPSYITVDNVGTLTYDRVKVSLVQGVHHEMVGSGTALDAPAVANGVNTHDFLYLWVEASTGDAIIMEGTNGRCSVSIDVTSASNHLNHATYYNPDLPPLPQPEGTVIEDVRFFGDSGGSVTRTSSSRLSGTALAHFGNRNPTEAGCSYVDSAGLPVAADSLAAALLTDSEVPPTLYLRAASPFEPVSGELGRVTDAGPGFRTPSTLSSAARYPGSVIDRAYRLFQSAAPQQNYSGFYLYSRSGVTVAWDPLSAFPAAYTVAAPAGFTWSQSPDGGLSSADVLILNQGDVPGGFGTVISPVPPSQRRNGGVLVDSVLITGPPYVAVSDDPPSEDPPSEDPPSDDPLTVGAACPTFTRVSAAYLNTVAETILLAEPPPVYQYNFGSYPYFMWDPRLYGLYSQSIQLTALVALSLDFNRFSGSATLSRDIVEILQPYAITATYVHTEDYTATPTEPTASLVLSVQSSSANTNSTPGTDWQPIWFPRPGTTFTVAVRGTLSGNIYSLAPASVPNGYYDCTGSATFVDPDDTLTYIIPRVGGYQ